MMRLSRGMTELAAELLLLLLAAPLLYFPNRFPAWAPILAIALLGSGWLWRRRQLGFWLLRTPADWPLYFLFFVMLPVSIWAAPETLRLEYSIPKAFVLVWNFCLYWTIVTHVGRSRRQRVFWGWGFVAGGALIALAALFGANWTNKVLALSPQVSQLPKLPAGVFEGAEGGFNPNQVAGTLLYVLPFALALLVQELRARRWWLVTAALGAVLAMGIVLIVAQSRAGMAGLAASLVVLLLAPFRWGRWLLAVGTVAVVAAILVLPTSSFLLSLDAGTRFDTATGGVNMSGRFEIWTRALYGIRDFPFTGMGLGTFREVVHLLYPLFTIPPTYDLAHAHNFFLQAALDFGLPGLVATLALYIVATVQGVGLARTGSFVGSRFWAVGLLAALSGQAVYSMADAVAMGAKTNLFFWYLLGLLVGLGSAASVAALETHPEMLVDNPGQ